MYINNQINSIISYLWLPIEGLIIKYILHYYYYYFLAVLCGILVSQPGIEVVPPALEAQSYPQDHQRSSCPSLFYK